MFVCLKKFKIIPIIKLLFFCSFFVSSVCQAEKIYRVGIVEYPPYVLADKNGYRGISVDIWKIISKRLRLSYVFVPMSIDIYQNVVSLHDGKIDILVGPVTANYERSLLAQFTRPYALNRVGIVVLVPKRSFLSILGSIMIRVFSWTMLTALIVIIFYAHWIWYFERHRLKSIPSHYFYGVRHVFWCCILKTDIPEVASTGAGRIGQLFWVSSSALFLSMVYAAMATSVHYASDPIKVYTVSEDFKGKRIVALPGGVGYRYSLKAGFNVTTVKDRDTGIKMVLNKQADGYADYYESSLYYLRQARLQDKLMLAPYVLKTSMLAFALPYGNTLLTSINEDISFLEEFSLITKICENYLKESDAAYCL